MPQSLVDIALEYTKKGMSVIPIAYGTKKPILPNWVQDCSRDRDKIEQWFGGGQSNIGIVTGRVSNIVVIDIDTKGDLDGRKSIALKEAQLGSYLSPTVTAKTQGGGIHLFYRYPAEETKITGRVGILPNVDIRADGNQVVVYPSKGEYGDYEWITPPWEHSFATLPKKWKHFICGSDEETIIRIPKRPFRLPDTVGTGMRHATLLSYACSLGAKGMGPTEISGAVREANKTICDPPISDEGELQNIIEWAVDKVENPSDPVRADGIPMWIDLDNKGRQTINEPNFTAWYKEENDLLCINGIFYNDDGVVDSNYIKQDIQNIVAPFVDSSLSAKVNALLEALKNVCFFQPPAPQRDTVNLADTSLRIDDTGIYEVDTPFTLNRLAVRYKPSRTSPMWNTFLSQLFHDEDVLTLQEYIGYCLVPTTIAQKSLFMIGKGGEGKSVVGEVVQALFGSSMIQGEIHKVQENRFMLAQLENKLVFYDDDLQSSALSDTGIFKKLVTATIPILVERKGEPHYEMLPYVRILASGNKGIEACYDHSDGFYRRIIMLHCKEKDRGKDDKLLAKKIIENELPGILNWALVGLQRLVSQEWEFSISRRAENVMREAEEEANNYLAFMRDYDALDYGEDYEVTSAELYAGYERWCEDNALRPLAMRTVYNYSRENLETFGIRYSNKVEGNKRGYVGVKLRNPIARVGTRFKVIRGQG